MTQTEAWPLAGDTAYLCGGAQHRQGGLRDGVSAARDEVGRDAMGPGACLCHLHLDVLVLPVAGVHRTLLLGLRLQGCSAGALFTQAQQQSGLEVTGVTALCCWALYHKENGRLQQGHNLGAKSA